MASKKSNPRRNFANTIVDAGESTAKKALRKLKAAADENARRRAAAAQRTKARLKDEIAADNSLRARLLRERNALANAPKNGDTTVKEGHTFIFKDGKWVKPASVADYKDSQGNLYSGDTGEMIQAAPLSIAAQRVTPPASPAPQGPSAHAPRVDKVAPAFPVAPTSETYRDGGSGLYQGSQDYRDALAKKSGGTTSGNPLLDRLRKDMGRDVSTGAPAAQAVQAAAAMLPVVGPAIQSIEQDTKAQPLKNAESLADRLRKRRIGAGYDLNNNIG